MFTKGRYAKNLNKAFSQQNKSIDASNGLTPLMDGIGGKYSTSKIANNSKSPWDDEVRRKLVVLFVELPLLALICITIIWYCNK